MKRLFAIILLCGIVRCIYAGSLSPLNFGLCNARTDIERYEVLRKTHEAALAQGCGVSYSGVGRIDVEIPMNGPPIPLTYYIDFGGTEIRVRNRAKNFTMFALSNKLKPILVNRFNLKKGSFFSDELSNGTKLLIISDKTPWVKQRRGYKYGATRKDVILLKNGRSLNNVIYPYSSLIDDPIFYYCDVTKQKITIKNLIFTRDSNSDYITQLFDLKNLNDVYIKDIVINTPEDSGLYGETIIHLENSTNIVMEDITINGTYSLTNKYGYGIGMNNVWNTHFIRLKAHGNWGIFGNNNVNMTKIDDCDINRFDIHCYGKDVYCKNTNFRDFYNQFSSFYGTLRYEKCNFYNFVPVLFESSYSAYTYFKLVFEDCTILVDAKRPYLVNAGNPSLLADNPRHELAKVSWPDIKIKNVTVYLPENSKKWILFYITGGEDMNISGMSKVDIDGLIIGPKTKKLGAPKSAVLMTNKKVQFENHLNTKLTNSTISTIYQE